MIPSAEVRWFRRGTIPPGVRAWFETRGSYLAAPPPRRDYYLSLSGETLGVKLREGRLEIKLRRQPGEFMRLHDRVTGIVERWRKWIFPLAPEAAALPAMVAHDATWIGVDKNRGLYRFRVAGKEPPVAVLPDVYPVQGCEVELSEVQAAGQTWWTMCFEAYGQERVLEESLQATAHQFLSPETPPTLDTADSHGYPRWLDLLAPRE